MILINEDVQKLASGLGQWCSHNKLTINIGKSKITYFNPFPDHKIFIDIVSVLIEKTVRTDSTVKILGP